MSTLSFTLLLLAACFAIEGAVIPQVVDWVTAERANKPIPITGPVEPKYKSAYGVFQHWSSGKFIHIRGNFDCPPDQSNLCIYAGVHLSGTMSFRFVQEIGHYGYLEQTCGSVIHPFGGNLDPPDQTRLVLHSGTHAGALFTINQDTKELIHRTGRVVHPYGGRPFPNDDVDVVIHHERNDVGRFEFVDVNTNKPMPAFPDPDLQGVWRIIYAVIDPLGDHEFTLSYKVGKSISKQASEEFEWTVSSAVAFGWFKGSTEYSELAQRTETITWDVEIERTINIKVPAGQTTVTWQYFFEADRFGDGLLFRSTILADTDDVGKPPELSQVLATY